MVLIPAAPHRLISYLPSSHPMRGGYLVTKLIVIPPWRRLCASRKHRHYSGNRLYPGSLTGPYLTSHPPILYVAGVLCSINSGSSVGPVGACRKHRHYCGNRHYSGCCRCWLFSCVPSDFTGSNAGDWYYRGATTNGCVALRFPHGQNVIHLCVVDSRWLPTHPTSTRQS